MANLKPALSEDNVKRRSAPELRKAYIDLANEYNKIVDGKVYFCHKCNEFHTLTSFYSDKRYASGLYPDCKQSLLEEATDYDKSTKTYKDNKEKTIKVFKKLDIPFIDSLYKSALVSTQIEEGEKIRQTAYQHLLTMVKSLPQYKTLRFENSEFDDDDEVVELQNKRTARKEIKRLFGSGFTEADYVYLQNQYDDWRARTQVDSKSQETYVMQICLQLLDIDKDRKSGKDVTNKLKALDTLMNAANLQPKQNVSNAATDSLTFGQLIEKWENEKPIPEPSEEFKDVDGIGKYLRVWFTGWLSKALGLKANVYTEEFDEEIAKYTVNKPQYTEEGNADEIYDRLFGSEGGD